MNKLIMVCCVVTALIISCNDESQDDTFFKLVPVYDSIGSCPEGGGVFVVSLSDISTVSGNIELSLETSPELNASLTKTRISRESPVTEVVIKPGRNIQTKNYTIRLNASCGACNTTIDLFVAVYDWSSEVSEGSLIKKDRYISWLQDNFSEINIAQATQWFAYPTYPQIVIVEHFTFLNDDYEFRICSHVMIPPYDWSMIRLRKRNETIPFLALRQDSTGGEIYQIPVEDYPVMLGY